MALYKPVMWLGQKHLIEFLSCRYIQASIEMSLKGDSNSQFKEARSWEICKMVTMVQLLSLVPLGEVITRPSPHHPGLQQGVCCCSSVLRSPGMAERAI